MRKNPIRRLAALALCLAMAVALSACGKTEPPVEATATPQPTATPVPTATPEMTETPQPTAETPAETPAEGDAITRYMETMTLREKVGQLFFVRPDALDPAQSPGEINSSETVGVKTLTEEMRSVLTAYPVGGVAIFGKNISDPETLRAFTSDLSGAVRVPRNFR